MVIVGRGSITSLHALRTECISELHEMRSVGILLVLLGWYIGVLYILRYSTCVIMYA